MHRLIAAISGVALALCLSACGSSGASVTSSTGKATSDQVSQTQVQQLKLDESGWTADDSGYVHYGVVITNPNANKDAKNPVIRVTGKDSSGNVVFSEDQYLFDIAPQQQVAFGTQAGHGTAPASVDFELVVKSSNWVDGSPLATAPFAISSTSETDSGYGTYSFAGIVANNTSKNYDTVAVTALLRDANGAIVSGYTSYVQGLNAGSSASFDTSGYNLSDFASVTYYAQAWSYASN